jgi:hypothetical protein
MRAGRRARALAVAGVVSLLPVVSGCQVGPAPPGPAEIRTGPPPWDAPRDAVAYFEEAGFEPLPLDFDGPAPYTVRLSVQVDGTRIEVPSDIGVDRVRAQQAAVHTHGSDGVVYVEAKTRAERPTLEQFFDLWGVRYDAKCLGDACGGVTVRVDGEPAGWDAGLTRGSLIQITARH